MQEIPADLKDIARGSVSAEWGRLDLQETQTQTIQKIKNGKTMKHEPLILVIPGIYIYR